MNQLNALSNCVEYYAAKKTTAAKKAKSRAKKTKRTARARTAPPAPGVALEALVAADPKNTAVNACVNAQMDVSSPGWNDNGRMDTDYRYNDHSMRAFLSNVRSCLLARHYNFDMNNDAFIQACVTSAVYRLKRRVYDRTT